MIGGDLNADVLKPIISLFFSPLGLHNLIFERHSPIGAPTTSAQNEQHKILDSFWGTANTLVARCGCCHPKAFPIGGHSIVWMDLTHSCALGHHPLVPHTFQAHRLCLDHPETVKSYQDRHRITVQNCSLLARQFNLEHSLLPEVPLTEAQSLEVECFGDLHAKSMLKAERKCWHMFKGGACFSLKVAELLAVLIFWELVISQRKGVDVCSRRIKQQKKAAKVTKAVALMDTKELEAKLRSARRTYRVGSP